jgi:hypothetical protein
MLGTCECCLIFANGIWFKILNCFTFLKYVTNGKRDFADVIKILRWGDYQDDWVGLKCQPTCPY